MFGLFKKKSKIEKLEDKHRKLLSKAYEISHSDRSKGDALLAEAEELANEIDKMKANEKDSKN
ncbi:Lacal_2735 family protein [Halocola ammonii]